MVIPKSRYSSIKESKDICNPRDVYDVFRSVISAEHETDRDKEHFWAIGLNTRNCIKYIELVSLGTVSASLVHPREVFRMAVMCAVSNVILVHNHPSGNPEPSEEDLRITCRLIDAGKIMGIEMIDHVVIGNDAGGYVSFKEKGLV